MEMSRYPLETASCLGRERYVEVLPTPGMFVVFTNVVFHCLIRQLTSSLPSSFSRRDHGFDSKDRGDNDDDDPRQPNVRRQPNAPRRPMNEKTNSQQHASGIFEIKNRKIEKENIRGLRSPGPTYMASGRLPILASFADTHLQG